MDAGAMTSSVSVEITDIPSVGAVREPTQQNSVSAKGKVGFRSVRICAPVPLNLKLQLKLKFEGAQLSFGSSGKEASVGSSDLASVAGGMGLM